MLCINQFLYVFLNLMFTKSPRIGSSKGTSILFAVLVYFLRYYIQLLQNGGFSGVLRTQNGVFSGVLRKATYTG